MAMKIAKIVKIAASTAKDVDIGYRTFLIENADSGENAADAYFREKSGDGTAVTSTNGWVLAPGESTSVPMTAKTLSVKGADIRILMLE